LVTVKSSWIKILNGDPASNHFTSYQCVVRQRKLFFCLPFRTHPLNHLSKFRRRICAHPSAVRQDPFLIEGRRLTRVGRGLIKLARAPSSVRQFSLFICAPSNIWRREPKAKARQYLSLALGSGCVCSLVYEERDRHSTERHGGNIFPAPLL
jgi:hypothetical protein